ncbi:MAG: methyltransferase [Planctomycetia bacterium]|nr:methyltransferase [Planctomycetia bacterium]
MSASGSSSLLSLMTGFWTSQAVYVAAKLELADLLADGPQTAEALAAKTGTNADALYRLLRALASLGLFREDGERHFHLTDTARPLQSRVPGSQRAVAIMMGEEHFACWGDLLYSIRTGRTAFDKVYGAPIFDWLSKHPEQARVFDEAMVGVHGSETPAMLDAYDFSGVNVVADVGGGNGSLLRGVLARYPQMRGMLCDLPGVVERAKAVIAADLGDRLQAIPTNFFDSVPAGADAYLLRHIIHDWNDEQSLAILKNVRRVVGPSGRLLLVEGVVAEGNEPDFTKLLDLNMLVIPGGKERTEKEYRELYAAAGFRLRSITPTKSYVSILDGRPA